MMRRKFVVPTAAAMSLGLAVTSCGPSGTPATATVTTIDRVCTIIEKRTREIPDPRHEGETISADEESSHQGDCGEAAEWQKVRTKRTKTVDGTATVHVLYTRADGKTGAGSLTFDGTDDEFYEMKSGDTFNVLVDEADPSKVYKA